MNLSILLFIIGVILIIVGYCNNMTNKKGTYKIKHVPRNIWDDMLLSSTL